MRKMALLVAALAIPCVTTSARADVGARSKAVEKDGISASISITNQQLNAGDQPTLKIRFENTSRDYINLYNIAACWKWNIVFTKLDTIDNESKTWRLQFNIVPEPHSIVFKQVKPGENYEVTIDLENDPPFTFKYESEAEQSKKPSPIRHLTPGKYVVKATVSLENPFGKDRHIWTGPITTEPVQFTVLDRKNRAKPSAKELAAYDKALQPVLKITSDEHGLWMNGAFPIVKLEKGADPEDVVAAVVNVNRSNIGTKAYRVLLIKRLEGEEGKRFVALISAGRSTKAVLCFPISEDHWWSRVYDAAVEMADPIKPKDTPGK
jgi:hypothetical protein